MPNRVLRDWTDSEKISTLGAHTERFFTRLIMKADDYGRFYANPKLLKPSLFPFLLDEITEADIETWLQALHDAEIIMLYQVDGKRYLQIEGFNQRLRISKQKYPAPPNGGHTTATRRPETETETEVETETEIETETEKNTAPSAAKTIDEKIELLAGRALKLKQNLRDFATQYPAQMLEDFFQYWTEANPAYTKLRYEMEKTWEVQKRLATWAARSKNFTKKTTDGQNNNPRKGQPDTGTIRAVARKILETAGGGANPATGH